MKALRLLFVPLLLVVLGGCSMHQQISIYPNGSGNAKVRVVLAPLIVRYMDDILASLGPPTSSGASEPALFDTGRIRAAFDALSGVKLTALSTPSRSTLDLQFTFDDINTVIPDLPGKTPSGGGASPVSPASPTGTAAPAGPGVRPLELRDHAGVKTLRLLLSRATWPEVASLPPLRGDPILRSLGPQESRHYTEGEYLNLLEYAFSDYASKGQVKQAVASSVVDIEVTVHGTIISEKGGVRSGNTVTYRIPLLEIVTLEKPIDLSVSFR